MCAVKSGLGPAGLGWQQEASTSTYFQGCFCPKNLERGCSLSFEMRRFQSTKKHQMSLELSCKEKLDCFFWGFSHFASWLLMNLFCWCLQFFWGCPGLDDCKIFVGGGYRNPSMWGDSIGAGISFCKVSASPTSETSKQFASERSEVIEFQPRNIYLEPDKAQTPIKTGVIYTL